MHSFNIQFFIIITINLHLLSYRNLHSYYLYVIHIYTSSKEHNHNLYSMIDIISIYTHSDMIMNILLYRLPHTSQQDMLMLITTTDGYFAKQNCEALTSSPPHHIMVDIFFFSIFLCFFFCHHGENYHPKIKRGYLCALEYNIKLSFSLLFAR